MIYRPPRPVDLVGEVLFGVEVGVVLVGLELGLVLTGVGLDRTGVGLEEPLFPEDPPKMLHPDPELSSFSSLPPQTDPELSSVSVSVSRAGSSQVDPDSRSVFVGASVSLRGLLSGTGIGVKRGFTSVSLFTS